MISNLADYFVTEQKYYLDKISYNRIDKSVQAKEHLLNCIDNIETNINGDIVKLTVQRTLKFDPEEIFNLSISFCAILKFNKKRKEDYDWEEINLAEEFRENGRFVLENLMSRITLLIAEITSSFGQMPIIPPPQVAPKSN